MPAPPLGSEPAIVRTFGMPSSADTDRLHRVTRSDCARFQDSYKHSTTTLQLILQAIPHAIHLRAWFTRNRDFNESVADPELLALT